MILGAKELSDQPILSTATLRFKADTHINFFAHSLRQGKEI